jgi:ribosomal-protein-alanine N-acetyltransferase
LRIATQCSIIDRFNFLTRQPSDLLHLTIESARLRLVAVSNDFEKDIFQEFNNEITRYMFPASAKQIEETRRFITESRCSMKAGVST